MKPNLTGTWRLNAEKSKLLGPAPSSDVVIEHHEPHFVSVITATGPGGQEIRVEFRGVTGGEEFENPMAGTAMRSRATWEGEELRIETWLERGGRKAHFIDYWWLADDQTLIMEHRNDDLAGQRSVLQRVGKGK